MKILVVDDEQVLVKGIKFNLENEGYEVECAYDGAAAVELAREGSFDLIILDLMMPKLDGLQACLAIREFSTVPIIMLTAKSEDADKLIGFESGADDYITKPFNPLEVVARVKTQLRRYRNYNMLAEKKPAGTEEYDIRGLRINRHTHKCFFVWKRIIVERRQNFRSSGIYASIRNSSSVGGAV